MAAEATDGAPEAPVYPPTVQLGDTVVWDVNGERQALVTLDARSNVKLGKVFCSAAPLVGCPYGAMFTLGADGKSLERAEYTPLTDWDQAQEGGELNTRTNAALVDNSSAQALSTADIEALKATGTAGADIVAALTANSATFAGKTEFAQEKYKKKKARKYIQLATVRRPTAAAVAEAYYANNASKTGYLRADALALLLSLANVGAHARVLVVESCGGLVTAAALERLGGGGAGVVVSAWPGGEGAKRPPLDLWRMFNLTAAQRGALRFAPLRDLLAEKRAAAAGGQQAAGEAAGAAAAQEAAPGQPQQRQQARNSTCGPPFNCCILAASGPSPLALVRHVLPLLAPSASLAVYSQYPHPLAEALDGLRGQGQVAGLALQECWWREMQVLPLRTHPTMNMNHGGGFLLSGTVLASQQQQEQVQQQQQQVQQAAAQQQQAAEQQQQQQQRRQEPMQTEQPVEQAHGEQQ